MARIARALLRELYEWLEAPISFMPGRLGRCARSTCLTRRLGQTGKGLVVQTGVVVTGHPNIKIGTNVKLSRSYVLYAHAGSIEMGDSTAVNSNTIVNAADGGEIIIGKDVLIAQNVVLRASDHTTRSTDIPINRQGHEGRVIIIEGYVWIAANVVITSNVKVGAHSIVAAGAVATKDVEPYSVVGGEPARLIRNRLDD